MLENISIEDRVFRSYGIAREARIMSSQEFMKLMSDIRLGVEGGLLKIDPRVIDDLCIKVQPYTLMLYGGEGMEIRQRDIKRAEIVRDKLRE